MITVPRRSVNQYKVLLDYANTQAKAHKNVNIAESLKYLDATKNFEKKIQLQELWAKMPKKMFF